MSRLTIANAVRDALEAGFTYKDDLSNHGRKEHWRSVAHAVREGHDWEDDCDGYALTAAQLAVEDYGVPEADVAIVDVKTETGGRHLVCFISGPNETWVIDNRQRSIWKPAQLPYEIKRGLIIGEGRWRKPK